RSPFCPQVTDCPPPTRTWAFSARVPGPGGRGMQKQTPSRPKALHTVSQMQKGVSLGGAVSFSRGPRPKAAPLSVHDAPAATRGSAGIDLVNQKNMDITLPGEVLLMPSQIQGPLPEGTVGLGLFVVPGVMDSDYGGIIHVQMWSHLPKQLSYGSLAMWHPQSQSYPI
uniref:dUTPase-like domain-containing protein n=1 Tax=Terrapene triunguis TaxID=2587831 RepID=A0A674J379_9SAUR